MSMIGPVAEGGLFVESHRGFTITAEPISYAPGEWEGVACRDGAHELRIQAGATTEDGALSDARRAVDLYFEQRGAGA